LADLGADVIKVEPPTGDSARQRGPFPKDIPHPEKSGLFLYLNANKRGITLDMKNAAGKKSLLRTGQMGRGIYRELYAEGKRKNSASITRHCTGSIRRWL